MTLRHDPFTDGLGEQTGPTHWPSLLPDETRPAWAELRDWVEQLVDRFALETRVIPPCWYRHNTLVEALSALRDHERICFAPNASPAGAVDWFRALREVEQRMIQACARTQCSVNEHRPDPARPWSTGQGPWQAFVEADATASSGSLTKASPTTERPGRFVYPSTGNRYRTRRSRPRRAASHVPRTQHQHRRRQ